MTTRSYSLHHLNLKVRGDQAVLNALDARLGRFPAGKTSAAADLVFEFHKFTKLNAHALQLPAGTGRPVLDPGSGRVIYFDGTQQLYIEISGRGQAICDTKSHQVHICYPEEGLADPWVLSHPFFTISLSEMLKRLGLYAVHAAGLAVGDQGVLIAGHSGAGKTTFALALVRAGFDFLADDTVFLSPRKTGMQVLAFPDEVDITAQTREFFPELHDLRGVSKPNARRKQAICPTNVYDVRPCWECTPAVILFPQPGKAERSVITALPKAEALLQLVCNVVRTEPRSSQAHLDALAALVKDCRCYRVQTGRDFDHLPDMVRSLLMQPEPALA